MKVTFRCKRSGNLVSFSNADDIAGLRKHEGYEEVTPVPSAPREQVTPVAFEPSDLLLPKRVGRPRKFA